MEAKRNTMTEKNYPKLLTIREAGRLGIMKPFTIRTMVDSGEIPYLQRGNRRYITESALRKAVESIS